MSLDTFKSLELGPIGIVDQDDVIYYRKQSIPTKHIATNEIETDVHLLKVASGMDSTLLNFLVEKGAKGIVIEAMGRGNVPPMMMDGIRRAVAHQIPVIIVSRCPMGRVLESYGYDGGGAQLVEAGAILTNNLNGQKARIQLMLALSVTKDLNEIKSYFMD